jgi:hypothetical protein
MRRPRITVAIGPGGACPAPTPSDRFDARPAAWIKRAQAGDEEIDRWHAEQRLRHAENKIAVAGRG